MPHGCAAPVHATSTHGSSLPASRLVGECLVIKPLVKSTEHSLFLFFCGYRFVESWRSRALGLDSFVLRDLLLLSCFSFEGRIKLFGKFSSRVIASATDLFV